MVLTHPVGLRKRFCSLPRLGYIIWTQHHTQLFHTSGTRHGSPTIHRTHTHKVSWCLQGMTLVRYHFTINAVVRLTVHCSAAVGSLFLTRKRPLVGVMEPEKNVEMGNKSWTHAAQNVRLSMIIAGLGAGGRFGGIKSDGSARINSFRYSLESRIHALQKVCKIPANYNNWWMRTSDERSAVDIIRSDVNSVNPSDARSANVVSLVVTSANECSKYTIYPQMRRGSIG